MTSDLAQRLRRLEDIEEIKKLKARYCEACDGGWDARTSNNIEGIVGSFAEDGVWDGGVYGLREGRAALREWYNNGQMTTPPFAFHLLTNPIIEVDGDHATGNWHLTICIISADQSSMLVGGVFDDEYVRTKTEGWRIKRSRFSLALHGTHESGSWSQGAAAKLIFGAGQIGDRHERPNQT